MERFRIGKVLIFFLVWNNGLWATAPLENPFGLMISGMSMERRIEVARELGVVYYRPGTAIFTGTWRGRNDECEAALKAGLKLVVTVRNGKGPGEPSSPPDNLEQYKKVLGQILEKYHPEILVIENEENSQKLFYSGTPETYLAQLKAAVEVAHSFGVKCTNGGLVCRLVALLLSESFRKAGDEIKAENVLRKATAGMKSPKNPGGPMIKKQSERGRAFLSGYRDTGIDYVNFHWYIPDSELLKEAISFLRKETGLPVILNEMGQQKSTDPSEVETMMNVIVNEKVPVAVWFSIDINAFAEARGLIEPDGKLRPNGVNFQKFIQTHFGRRK